MPLKLSVLTARVQSVFRLWAPKYLYGVSSGFHCAPMPKPRKGTDGHFHAREIFVVTSYFACYFFAKLPVSATLLEVDS